MEAVEIIGLERSRENQRMIAITLMLVVSAVLISCISDIDGNVISDCKKNQFGREHDDAIAFRPSKY